MSFRYGSTAGNYYIVGPFSLTAGTTYNASILYKVDGKLGFGPLELTYGTANTAAAQTNSIVSIPADISNTDYKKIAGDFTVSADGSYYISVKCTSTTTPSYLTLDDFSLKTKSTCAEPTGVTLSNITSSGVNISWSAPSSAPAGYDVYVSSTHPTDASTPTNPDITSTSLSVSSLSPGTIYYVGVRSKCSTSDVSTWVVSSFTAPCASADLPYSENFDSVTAPALPTCTSTQTLGTSNGWLTNSATSSVAGFSTSGKILRYSKSTVSAANTWFFTKGLNLTAGTQYVVKFRVGGSSLYFTEKMKVAYGTSPTGAEMAYPIADYPNVPQANSIYDTYYFTPTTTGIYYVGFKAYSDASQGYLYLDDISIDVAPSCTIPGTPSVSGITETEATVSWTASTSNPSNGYDIYYSTSSTAPTAATTPNYEAVIDLSKTLSGLSPGTPYFVWVRANCSTSDKSDWTNYKNFATACPASFNVPYTQNFETSVVPNIPICTSTENLSGVANDWATYTNKNNTLTGNWLICIAKGTAASDAWFYTPAINLESGKTYKISYNYTGGNDAGGYVDKLKVAYGTAASSTGMSTVLANYSAISNSATTISSDSVSFTPSATGTYYFGFNAYSDAGQNFVAVDNISIIEDTALATDTNIKTDLSIYPNPFADVIHISDIKNIKSVTITDATGRMVKQVNTVSTSINLGNLKSGLYLIQLNYNDGSTNVQKLIKK